MKNTGNLKGSEKGDAEVGGINVVVDEGGNDLEDDDDDDQDYKDDRKKRDQEASVEAAEY